MNHLKSLIACASLVGATCLLTPGVSAQANPRIGVWTLDLVASTYQQGKAPASETRTFLTTDDGGIQMTGDTVLSSGTKQPTGYRAKYDGKDHAYSGGAGDTIAMTGNGWASDSTIKIRGKVVQTTHGVVSKDGQTMTLTTKTAAGYDVSTRVYKKQK